MTRSKTLLTITGTTRHSYPPEFQGLPTCEVEWFKNFRNPSKKRVYKNAVKDFLLLIKIKPRKNSAL